MTTTWHHHTVSDYESDLLRCLRKDGDQEVGRLATTLHVGQGATTVPERWHVFRTLLSLERRHLTRMYNVGGPTCSAPQHLWTLVEQQ